MSRLEALTLEEVVVLVIITTTIVFLSLFLELVPSRKRELLKKLLKTRSQGSKFKPRTLKYHFSS